MTAFLLSIDLEDPRAMIPDGMRHPPRVRANAEQLLDFLAARDCRCTWFTVGDVARQEPDLVRRIADAGHEIGCHGDVHATLDRLDPASFRSDLGRCLESLERAGATRVRGFRAPVGSLVEATRWAYPALREYGFDYSSSVCPSRTYLYGWPGFGEAPRQVEGVWEVPSTLSGLPVLNVPLGGVFLRVLPLPLLRLSFRRRLRRAGVVTSYLHPHDVDTERPGFRHPGLGGSRVLEVLMHWNRRDVFRRLDRLLSEGAPVLPMGEWVDAHLSPGSGPAATLPPWR